MKLKRLIARLRKKQSGQAVTESSVLLATLVAGLFFGGVILNKFHPDWMNAIDVYMKGFYFVLSLPVP
jgi:hypothetical protein